MTIGAMLNMQVECLSVKNAFYDFGAIPLIFNALSTLTSCEAMPPESQETSVYVQTVEWALRLLDDIFTADESKAYTWTPPDAQMFFRQLQMWSQIDSVSSIHADVLEHRISIIESASSILDHETQNSTFCVAIASVDDPNAIELLLHLVHNPFSLDQWCGTMHDSEDALASDAQQVFGHLKKAATHAIVALAGEDANLGRLCPLANGQIAEPNDLLDTLCVWAVDTRSDPRQAVCAILALGNFARDHTRSMALAARPHLLVGMHDQMQQHADNVHIAYAVIRASGNFAIPDENKQAVVQSGVIKEACVFLAPEHDMKSPVQAGVLVLLKNLSSSVAMPTVALSVMECMKDMPSPLMVQLIGLWQRTDDMTTKLRIARIYVTFLRCVCGADKSETSLDRIASHTGITRDELVTMFMRAEKELCVRPVMEALCHLICHYQKHVVLLNEGLLGLILFARSTYSDKASVAELVFTAPTPMISQEGQFASVADALPFIIQEMPAQVASNAHVLWLLFANDERASHGGLRERVDEAWNLKASQGIGHV